MKSIEEKIIGTLQEEGVRVYGKTIVSPYRTKDSPAKCQLINFMIEKCGYVLVDERGYPPRPPAPVEEDVS